MKVKISVLVTPVMLLSLLLLAALPAAGQLLVIGGGGRYQHIVRVAPSGAPFTSIQAAIDSIGDESESNRYLVSVAPGTYSETVTMTPWISLRGSGQRATIITAPGSASAGDATLHGANNSEISLLTVQNTGGGGNTYAKAISCNATSPRINQVEILVAAAGADLAYGIMNSNGAKPDLTDVSCDVSGGSTSNYGILNTGLNSSPTMLRVRVEASGGDTAAYAIYNFGYAAPTGQFIYAEAGGADGTNAINAAIVSRSYAVTNFSSVQARATASGSNFAYAVYALENATLSLHGLEAFASCATASAYGVCASGAGDCTVDQAHIQVTAASTAGEAHGLSVWNCGFKASNFSITARGAGSNTGLFNTGAGLRRYSQGSMIMTPESTAGGYGLVVISSAEVEGDNLTARVSGGTGINRGVLTGHGITLRLSNCNLSAEDYGLDTQTASPSSTVHVDSSRLSGSSAVYNRSGNSTYLGSTLLEGSRVNAGTLTCYQCFDQTMGAVGCP